MLVKGIGISVATLLLAIVPSNVYACNWPGAAVVGEYGGFTFYKGLIVQKDETTGRKLPANKAVTVSGVAACAQLCLSDSNCSGVSYRNTSNGQCLIYVGYDYETGHQMDLALFAGQGVKPYSAIIRKSFQGSVCR